jgi:hypothetical protein
MVSTTLRLPRPRSPILRTRQRKCDDGPRRFSRPRPPRQDVGRSFGTEDERRGPASQIRPALACEVPGKIGPGIGWAWSGRRRRPAQARPPLGIESGIAGKFRACRGRPVRKHLCWRARHNLPSHSRGLDRATGLDPRRHRVGDRRRDGCGPALSAAASSCAIGYALKI